jgi:subtilisin family serine protease
MDRTVKIYCSGSAQKQVAERYRVIESYDAFVLAEVPSVDLGELRRAYLVEDITDLYTLRVGEREIDTSIPRLDAKGAVRSHPAYRGTKPLSAGRHHHLVQFIGPIKETWLAAVRKAGGEPRAPFSDFAYVVRADDAALARIAALSFVRWVGHLPHQVRVDPSVFARAGRKAADVSPELPRTRVLAGAYLVEFFGSDDLSRAEAGVRKAGFRVLEKDPGGKVMVVEVAGTAAAVRKRIEALAAVHGVRSIRERSLKRTSNDVAAGIMGTSRCLSASGLGLSGNGECIAVADTGLDTGDPKSTLRDFGKRVAWIKSYPITGDLSQYVRNPGGDDGPADLDSGHGTHVAGSVLGDGTSSDGLPGLSGPIRGLAHKARLVFQAVEQEMKWKNPAFYQQYGRYMLAGIPLDLATLFLEAYKKRARIHSNSWGGGQPGEYDSQCEQLDRFVWEHKDFCILVAAGNDGTDRDGDGKINPRSVTSPGTAKNCITIGACENDRRSFNGSTYGRFWAVDYPVPPFRDDPMADNPDQVAPFSSRGPTADGRIKPDVVAPGTFILSTRSTMIAPNNKAWGAFPPSPFYFHMGGTSMATPLTAGAVALVREYLRKKKRIANPSAALLKAVLVAGAVRLPGNGPSKAIVDIHQGYGRVNLDNVLSPAPPVSAFFSDVKPGLRTGEGAAIDVKIRPGGGPFRVVLAYSDYPGPALVNNLNLLVTAPDGKIHAGNPTAGAGTAPDTKNNVEVVHVPTPAAGDWKIEVIGSNIPRGPQDYAIVCLGRLG